MSAIPNVPESMSNGASTNADAALRHLLHNNQTTVQQTEQPHLTNGEAKLNGVKTETSPFLLHDSPIENQRPVKVIIIGAGYSGVYCGIRIPERIRNCELVIYEKNAGIAGTWYENRYPGAACDVPSHSYQFSFNPKPDWTALYAPASEIREYIQSTARKYGADRFIKLSHEVKSCSWDKQAGKWHVSVQRPDGSILEDSSDVLISARGLLNTKQWPVIPGLHDFKGELMHSAAWNEHYDFTGKRIGLIGSGSSAIQILPQLQRVPGAQLTAFIRNRTWISPPFGQAVQDSLGMGDDFAFTEELKEKFKKDPKAWLEFRCAVEAGANGVHAITLKGTPMQVGAQKAFEDGMRARLESKPQYFDWLRPQFSPGCRRLTPGPGFLEALCQPNVTFTKDAITHISATGIHTADGRHHPLDALVCATGFYASAAPPFPVTGLEQRTLQQYWHTRALNYLSLATDGFPNHFFMLGPNGAIGEGSLTMMIESAGDYITKAIRKLQKDNLKSMAIKADRVRDWTQYCDIYFRGTVFMDECQSWYRKDGQGKSADVVTGLWPGSALHCIEALRSPRWEDFDYEVLPEANGAEGNALAWLGNGWAQNQLADPPRPVDLAFYLTPEFQERDIGVPVAPRPEENEHYRIRPWSY